MSVDLRTRYLGLDLRNPLVVSACPLTSKIDMPVPAGGSRRRCRGHALALRGTDRRTTR